MFTFIQCQETTQNSLFSVFLAHSIIIYTYIMSADKIYCWLMYRRSTLVGNIVMDRVCLCIYHTTCVHVRVFAAAVFWRKKRILFKRRALCWPLTGSGQPRSSVRPSRSAKWPASVVAAMFPWTTWYNLSSGSIGAVFSASNQPKRWTLWTTVCSRILHQKKREEQP